MSADLLRRAAIKLREHAAGRESFAPWTAETHADGRSWVNLAGVTHAWGMHGFPGEAHLIALMHPPVALALADLLDRVIESCAITPCPPAEPYLAVARAVLREPEETRDA